MRICLYFCDYSCGREDNFPLFFFFFGDHLCNNVANLICLTFQCYLAWTESIKKSIAIVIIAWRTKGIVQRVRVIFQLARFTSTLCRISRISKKKLHFFIEVFCGRFVEPSFFLFTNATEIKQWQKINNWHLFNSGNAFETCQRIV